MPKLLRTKRSLRLRPEAFAGGLPFQVRKWIAWVAFGSVCFVGVHDTAAQSTAQRTFLSRSVSGQFIIQSAPGSFGSPIESFLQNDTNFVRLDPVLLTVSCERIKQILWRLFGASPSWKSKVFLRLYQTRSPDDSVLIDSEQFRDGWQYRLSLPNICQRERYVRAIVTVLLLELANRGASAHAAEVPPWAAEGLAREIWASNQREVILPQPQMSDAGLRVATLLVNARKENSLEQAHQELCAGKPLSFQQLSWPVPDPLTGESGELYRSTSQVFCHQLLALPNGPSCLMTMLQNLPRFYNWQFAFFEAFRDYFLQPLDVEKWWSLQLVHFTGRELAESWSPDESWEKLDESVRSAVQIRIGTNEVPLHAEVALQSIIRDWPASRQTSVLGGKLQELRMLRLRLSPDLVPLLDDYCRVIETHLDSLNRTGFVLPFRKHVMERKRGSDALQRLDELDSRRLTMRPAPKASLSAQDNSRSGAAP